MSLKHLARHARVIVVVGLAALSAIAAPTRARADGIPKDEITSVKKPAADQDSGRAWLRKMAGSSVEVSSYVGSGSFYATGYRDPYVSTAVFLRPTYDLGTRFKLSANARLYAEEELTQSDLPNGRSFNPYDIWLWLSAKELHKFEASKIRLGATGRLVLPISYESLYAHMLVGVAGGLNLTRAFEFGRDPAPERRWNLAVSVGSVFTKYLYTSDLRGNGPGDSTGCRSFLAAGAASAAVGGGPSASESDRCGGPVNTNFSLTSSVLASLTRGKWSVSSILVVANVFRYDVPIDAFTPITANDVGRSPITANDVGRADTTWGIVSLNYSYTDHIGASVGLSSYQPALDSQYRNLRFPFFDFSGGANANNFTQAFVSLNGTL